MNRMIARAGANLLALGCLLTILAGMVYGYSLTYYVTGQLVGVVLGFVAGTIVAALTFGPLAAIYDMRASLAKLADAAASSTGDIQQSAR
jgi:hypothetical protein